MDITRRLFLNNGGIALASIGFAPVLGCHHHSQSFHPADLRCRRLRDIVRQPRRRCTARHRQGEIRDDLHAEKSQSGVYVPANGAVYPNGRFGDSHKQIAQLFKADVGVKAAFTEMGGWDTHINEGPHLTQ